MNTVVLQSRLCITLLHIFLGKVNQNRTDRTLAGFYSANGHIWVEGVLGSIFQSTIENSAGSAKSQDTFLNN